MIDELYRDELRRLHEAGRAFTAAHPDTAPWLASPGDDPDVERLLEGTAFLAARIRQRIAAADDELAQGLCAALLPTAMRPLPSLAIMRFSSTRHRREGETVPAGTMLESQAVDGEACRFRLAWDAQVPPAVVSGIALLAGERPRLEIALALPEGLVPESLGPSLRLHAHAEPALARALVQALATARALHAATESGRLVPMSASWCGPGAAPPLLPGDAGSAAGHGILVEALAWPELSLFVDLSGPPGLGVQAGERGVRIVAELDHLPGELRGVGSDDLLLGCAPALNLHSTRGEPLLIDGTRRELPVAVAGLPGALPWAVLAVRGGGPGRRPRSWPQARAALAGPCWQELHGEDGLELAIGGLDAEAQGEVLSLDILAHDGPRAGRIGAGGIRTASGSLPGGIAMSNLRPATRPLAAPAGSGRLRALALRLRTAATGIRDRDGLAGLLDLHDRQHAAESAGRADAPRVSAALRGHHLEHRAVPWGAAVARALVHRLVVDPAAVGGAPGAWILGCALERALAALAPLGTVTALEMALTGGSGGYGELRWPPRCPGAEA